MASVERAVVSMTGRRRIAAVMWRCSIAFITVVCITKGRANFVVMANYSAECCAVVMDTLPAIGFNGCVSRASQGNEETLAVTAVCRLLFMEWNGS